MTITISHLDNAIVGVESSALAVPKGLQSVVEDFWSKAQLASVGKLHNGKILSCLRAGTGEIAAEIREYKQLIAQLGDPNLFVDLKLRPLAVSGILVCPDGLVFGERSIEVTQHPGKWELVPSGGVDPPDTIKSMTFDAGNQILMELKEEIGIDVEQLTDSKVVCAMYNNISNVVDIGFVLETGLRGAGIASAHRKSGSGEYSQLAFLRREDVKGCIDEDPDRFVAESKVLVDFFLGNLRLCSSGSLFD